MLLFVRTAERYPNGSKLNTELFQYAVYGRVGLKLNVKPNEYAHLAFRY